MAAWILRQVHIILFIFVSSSLGMPQIPSNDSHLTPRGNPMWKENFMKLALDKQLLGSPSYRPIVQPIENLALTECLPRNQWKKERLVSPYHMRAGGKDAGLFFVFTDDYIFSGLLPINIIDRSFNVEDSGEAAVPDMGLFRLNAQIPIITGIARNARYSYRSRGSLAMCQTDAGTAFTRVYGVVGYFPTEYLPRGGLETELQPWIFWLKESLARQLKLDGPGDPAIQMFSYNEATPDHFAILDLNPDESTAELYAGLQDIDSGPLCEVKLGC